MRIIKRTHPINNSVLYIVQDDGWNGAVAYQNMLGQTNAYTKRYNDIQSFASLEEAQKFGYKYENSLGPGEEIVSK